MLLNAAWADLDSKLGARKNVTHSSPIQKEYILLEDLIKDIDSGKIKTGAIRGMGEMRIQKSFILEPGNIGRIAIAKFCIADQANMEVKKTALLYLEKGATLILKKGAYIYNKGTIECYGKCTIEDGIIGNLGEYINYGTTNLGSPNSFQNNNDGFYDGTLFHQEL